MPRSGRTCCPGSDISQCASSAGLRIAKGPAPITRTWILYNKPKVPQYTHAGVLMGLGLAGKPRKALLAIAMKQCWQLAVECRAPGQLLNN